MMQSTTTALGLVGHSDSNVGININHMDDQSLSIGLIYPLENLAQTPWL